MNTAAPTAEAPEATTTPEITDEAAMQAALAADAGAYVEPSAKPADDTNEGNSADAPQPNGKSTAKDNSATTPGSEKKPAAPSDKKDAGKPGDATKETPYTKAQKEQERQRRVLEGFQQEKEQFRADKARYDSELQNLRCEVQQLRKSSAPAGPVKDKDGHTAEVYDQLAKQYADEGNDSMAKLAKERADGLRAQAQQQSQTTSAAPADPSTQPEFISKWNENLQALVAQNPELNNPENPIVKATNGLLNDKTYGRLFRADPIGIKAAHEVALLLGREREASQKLTTVEGENKTLKAEVQRLNGLLQPRGSHPSGPPPGERKLADMNAEEADTFARELALKADRGEI